MNKTYVLSKVNQLVDLNGELVNFEANFRVKSKKGEPFELLVIDQATLDNTPNVEFKKVVGEISGTVKQDKNVYQNYCLILKAEPPCECDVTIDLKEIPAAVVPQTNPQPVPKANSKMWMYILGALAIAGVVWYFFFKGKKVPIATAPDPIPRAESPGLPSPRQAPENPLFERLRKLNLT